MSNDLFLGSRLPEVHVYHVVKFMLCIQQLFCLFYHVLIMTSLEFKN